MNGAMDLIDLRENNSLVVGSQDKKTVESIYVWMVIDQTQSTINSVLLLIVIGVLLNHGILHHNKNCC